MKTEAENKLSNLYTFPFFRKCGEALPQTVHGVQDWKHAIEEVDSRRWENCRLMARNALQRFTEMKNWSRSEEWNSIAQALRPNIDNFVGELMGADVVPGWASKKLAANISWDLMLICLEHAYRDVVRPLFYIPHIEPWYAVGHLPCGWDGPEFPEPWDGLLPSGRLIVF